MTTSVQFLYYPRRLPDEEAIGFVLKQDFGVIRSQTYYVIKDGAEVLTKEEMIAYDDMMSGGTKKVGNKEPMDKKPYKSPLLIKMIRNLSTISPSHILVGPDGDMVPLTEQDLIIDRRSSSVPVPLV